MAITTWDSRRHRRKVLFHDPLARDHDVDLLVLTVHNVHAQVFTRVADKYPTDNTRRFPCLGCITTQHWTTPPP